MLNFLFNSPKYISCEWLEYGMNCAYDGLYNCCMFAHTNKNFHAVCPTGKDGKYNFKEFFRIKNEYRKSHKKGIIIERCNDFPNLKESVWNKKFQIKHISIATNTKCNSDCIYCYSHKRKDMFNKMPDIPILNFLTVGFERKIFSNNIFVLFGGREPVLNHEFENILSLFLNHPFEKIKIYSSGIKYSNAIEKCLETGKCELVITLDCGDKELYKKIKNVDKFDEVMTNIKNYSSAQKHGKTQVRLKYIMLPGLNDNKKEIDKFFEKVIDANIKYIKPEIEISLYQRIKNNEKELKRYFSLLKYMENCAEINKIEHGVAGNFYCAVETYRNLYDSQ